jgi:hypothetical protein
MNNIQLGPGTISIDGQEVGVSKGIPEIKLCDADDDHTVQSDMYKLLLAPGNSVGVLSASVDMAKEAFIGFVHFLMGIDRELENSCPNRRVVHLWKHGKNARIRKKNYKRMIKYAERSKERKNET